MLHQAASPFFCRLGGVALGVLGLASCSGGGGGDTAGVHQPRFGPDPSSVVDPGRRVESRPATMIPEFVVENSTDRSRSQLVMASVPFPKSMVQDLSAYTVEGRSTVWQALQHWADGSVRIGQAQFLETMAPQTTRNYRVVPGASQLGGSFQQHPHVAHNWPSFVLGSRLRDTFGHPYEARLEGAGEVLQETAAMRVRRFRRHHHALTAGGIDRSFLTSTWYVTEFADSPILVVDWILGNDYRGADNPSSTSEELFPLGPVDINRAVLFASRFPRFQEAGRHGVGSAVNENGEHRLEVMSNTWIADGQSRRYRVRINMGRFDAPAADQDVVRDTVVAMSSNPLRPLASWRSWRDSYAAGLYGAPVRGPAQAKTWARNDYFSWLGRDHFGTWGSFGDVKLSATTGTPRNSALSPDFAHAIQAAEPRLLHTLEQQAWAQAMRPYHLYGLEVGDRQDILLWDGVPLFEPNARDLSPESLGRRALWANDPFSGYRTRVDLRGHAHGWNWGDEEHMSTDLLFDYWSVSGDAWAKEELRQLGQTLKGLHRYHGLATANVRPARAEGWMMQAFVQCYQATRDEGLKNYVLERIRRVVEPNRNHASRAIGVQWNYPGTGFGGSSHSFFMTWQHGAVLSGYLAAHEFFDHPMPLRIAEDVLTTIRYAWVSDFADPRLGYVEHGLRYYTPVSFEGEEVPAGFFDFRGGIGVRWASGRGLGGTTTMLLNGLHLLADYSETPLARQEALWYAQTILPGLDEGARWNKWLSVTPD